MESLNGKLPDELLNLEISDTLWDAQILIESWRQEYNRFRPDSALGLGPPAPETLQPFREAVGAKPLGLLREVVKL